MQVTRLFSETTRQNLDFEDEGQCFNQVTALAQESFPFERSLPASSQNILIQLSTALCARCEGGGHLCTCGAALSPFPCTGNLRRVQQDIGAPLCLLAVPAGPLRHRVQACFWEPSVPGPARDLECTRV